MTDKFHILSDINNINVRNLHACIFLNMRTYYSTRVKKNYQIKNGVYFCGVQILQKPEAENLHDYQSSPYIL